jgi:hypothetical protein
MSHRDARAVIGRLADYETRSQNSHISAVIAIRPDQLQVDWSDRERGTIFQVNKETVHRVRSKGMSSIEHDAGRPTLLQSAEEACPIAHIADRFQARFPDLPRQVQTTSLKHLENKLPHLGHRGWSSVI